MNADFRTALEEVAAQLQADEQIAGIIFRSAKKTFFAGGDLDELIQATPEHATEFFNMIEDMKAKLRYIETRGIPVVAALNGTALGGGWEIALCAHHRIALNDAKTKFGLPEVTLGLLPGGGGIVRMVRLLGLQNALPLLMEGKQFGVEKAKSLGLVHDTADSLDELLDKSIAWIKQHPQSQQPFDVKVTKFREALLLRLPLHRCWPLLLRCCVIKPRAAIQLLKPFYPLRLKALRLMLIPH